MGIEPLVNNQNWEWDLSTLKWGFEKNGLLNGIDTPSDTLSLLNSNFPVVKGVNVCLKVSFWIAVKESIAFFLGRTTWEVLLKKFDSKVSCCRDFKMTCNILQSMC